MLFIQQGEGGRMVFSSASAINGRTYQPYQLLSPSASASGAEDPNGLCCPEWGARV